MRWRFPQSALIKPEALEDAPLCLCALCGFHFSLMSFVSLWFSFFHLVHEVILDAKGEQNHKGHKDTGPDSGETATARPRSRQELQPEQPVDGQQIPSRPGGSTITTGDRTHGFTGNIRPRRRSREETAPGRPSGRAT